MNLPKSLAKLLLPIAAAAVGYLSSAQQVSAQQATPQRLLLECEIQPDTTTLLECEILFTQPSTENRQPPIPNSLLIEPRSAETSLQRVITALDLYVPESIRRGCYNATQSFMFSEPSVTRRRNPEYDLEFNRTVSAFDALEGIEDKCLSLIVNADETRNSVAIPFPSTVQVLRIA